MSESRQVKTLAFDILKQIIIRNAFCAARSDETVSCRAIAVTLSEVFTGCRHIFARANNRLLADADTSDPKPCQIVTEMSRCTIWPKLGKNEPNLGYWRGVFPNLSNQAPITALEVEPS